MQLPSRATEPFTGKSLPEAVQFARAHRGHAPAITAVTGDRRDEHGVTNLAQWIGKGAHLLLSEHALQPGDVVAVVAPVTWTTAVVCHAAWWIGAHVIWSPTAQIIPDQASAAVAVIHDAVADQQRWKGECYWLGDQIDGASRQPSWTVEAQLFPDYPPPAMPADPALTIGSTVFTQQELVDQARSLGAGTIGIDHATDARTALIAGCVRPFVALEATVILRDAPRSAVTSDRIATWR